MSTVLLLFSSLISVSLAKLNNSTAIKVIFNCSDSDCDSGLLLFEAFNQIFRLPIRRITSTSIKDCFYIGPTNNATEWLIISLTTCNQKFKGLVIGYNQVYVLIFDEIRNRQLIKKWRSNHDYVNTKSPFDRRNYYTIETSDDAKNKATTYRQSAFSSNFNRLKYIKMDCYVDTRMNMFARDRPQLLIIIKRLIGHVNAIWSQVGLIFQCERDNMVSEDWAKSSIDTEEAFKNFKQFLSTKIDKKPFNYINFGIAVYIFGTPHPALKGKPLGASISKSVCDLKNAVIVVAYDVIDEEETAYTLARELGHVLGVKDDDEYNNRSECGCLVNKCLMSSDVGFPILSNCSKNQVADLLSSGKLICLHDKIQSGDTGICGDGIIDYNEQCDCIGKYCSKCCRNCQLTSGNCGSGECCDFRSCTLIEKTDWYACRPAISACDLTEYCDGELSICPDDEFATDHIPCSTNLGSGYCFKGRCGTYEDACVDIFGPMALVGSDECFKNNKKGTTEGNCAVALRTGSRPEKKLTACEDYRIKCGLLFCVTPSLIEPRLPAQVTDYLNNTVLTPSGEICRGVFVQKVIAALESDPSYAPEGAPCQSGLACKGQYCEPIEQIERSAPEMLGCRINCKGRGSCDRKGVCHCFTASTKQDCSTEINFLAISLAFSNFVFAVLLILASIYFRRIKLFIMAKFQLIK